MKVSSSCLLRRLQRFVCSKMNRRYDARQWPLEKIFAKFDVSGIPSVIMLRRDEAMGGKFALLDGGREGRSIMAGNPQKAVADFPWAQSAGARQSVVMALARNLGELEQSLSSRAGSLRSPCNVFLSKGRVLPSPAFSLPSHAFSRL